MPFNILYLCYLNGGTSVKQNLLFNRLPMKKYLSAILFFFFAVTVQAQYQSSFWGMTYDGGNGGGVIFRTNGYGDSLEVKHTFISSPGRNSLYSQLCEAPNGKLYGMTYGGGAYDYGVLFEYDKQTGTYQAKIIFSGAANGRNPYGSLIQASNGKLYGMTYGGGTNGQGVLFEYDPSTDTYTKKIDFSSAVSGRNPYGTLMEASNGMLYGLTSAGGANNMGVLFEYNPSTEVLTKKWDFDGAASGRNPYGTLMEASNGMLYGMTYSGGSNGYGVLFEYNPVSTVLAKKADFTGTANGRGPYGALVEFSNGLLYGMTPMGGASGYGVLFEYDPASAVLTKKWDFDGPTYGRTPYGSLMTACGKLYGLTSSGGSNTKGVLFDFDPASGILSKRMDFDGIPAGSSPFGSLMLASDGKIYGLTYSGGLNNYGVLFEYDCATDGFIKKVDFSETTNGGYPFGSLVNTSGHDLYGMTTYGGTSDFGVLFLYNPVSATYTRRVDFSGIPNGGYPVGNLLDASNGLLYGITYGGGAFDKGVLFEYNPATDTYVTKRNLDSATTGSFPYGSLIETSTGILYGMTSFGGSTNLGVIFSYNYITDSYTVKKTFDGAASGKNPYGDFVLAGNGKLYAMTYAGGANDLGVLFEYDIATNTYTKKIDFDGTTNGANPYGSLIEASNGKLYGLTSKGGTNNMGVLFEYNPLTSVFIKRIDFTGAANGNGPQGTLMESSGGKLYGMTYSGGTNNLGVLFEFDPGSGILTKKFDFDAEKGKNPYYTKLIEVCDPPGFIFPVSDASVCLNENTFFICAATGNWLTYQWQVDTGSGFADVVDNTVYSGAQNDTLFLYGVGAGMNGYLYRCVVSSSCPDSVIFSQTGVLNVRPHYEFTENTEICDNEDYFWHGTMYATTGTYYDSLQTIYGCDSVYILHLLVHPTYEYTLNAEICDNEVYTWRGNDYTFSGTYYDSLQTMYGCDSVYILHLLVHPTYENTLNADICDDEVYTWRGNSYSFTGTYYDSLQTMFGCDSVYILRLQVHPSYVHQQSAVICSNQSIIWRGNSYNTTGTYYDSLQTVHGCDSIFVLHLQANPVYTFTENAEICSGQDYFWRGNSYNTTGTFIDILPTQQGCDSTYILNLTVHQAYEQTQYAAVCEGQSFIWHGNPYNATGEYYDSLVTQFGCDSVFHLLLTVNPLPVVALSGLEAFYCEYNPPASASGTPPGGEFGGPGMFGNTFIPSNANQGNNTIVYTYVSSSGCANSDTLVIWVDECASLADAGKTGVNVFPNPTGGILNINLSEAGLHKLILSDAIGQVVFSREVPGKQVLQVDLSRMVAGVYMLKIESGSGIVVKRIVVER